MIRRAPSAWEIAWYLIDRRAAIGVLALLVIAALAVGAGIHHVERDRRVSAALEDALYLNAQQKAMLELAERNHGSMSVRLARVPASDIAYDLVMVPRLDRVIAQ